MYRIIHIISLLLVANTMSLFAQDKLSAAVTTTLEIMTESLIQQAHLPGVSIAVSKNEQLIYAQGFGYADIDLKTKMTVDHRIRAASVSKVITATALGKLATDGLLDFDIPIKQYVPYIDAQYADLTTRQLAGHTAGMAHRPKGSKYKKKQYNEMQPTVQLMDAPLLFEPDTQYQYSTHAYNLLGAVIEGASGKSYASYLQSMFKDLGMTQTYAENIEQLNDQDANIYYVKDDRLKKERLTNGSYKIPGAGFRSTPTDLVKMMSAYTNGYISEAIVTAMFESHHLKNGKATRVGIGWRSSIDAFGNEAIEHAGSWMGARTVIVHYPEENLNISLMVNASCNLLIEETAHLLAEVIRNLAHSNASHVTVNTEVDVTFNSQEGVQKYKGNLQLDGTKGVLETNNKGFLKETTIHHIGSTNHYALATSFGLLYLRLDSANGTEGHVYTYFNRSSSNPTKDAPLITIRSL